jgi:release factor glutamine methyltransferase
VVPPDGPSSLFGWVRDAATRLAGIEAGNPRLEAEHLMAAALAIPRIELWLIDRDPSPEEIAAFESLLARRLAREPLQYVLGNADFAGLTLGVAPGVFIPRNETEILVERAAARLRRGDGAFRARPLVIDVGTGSGAILLALLTRFPDARGIGIDRDPRALACARGNARRLRLAGRAEWVRGDLLAGIGEGAGAIVSNPPYVRLDEAADLAPEIREHEPGEALFAGPDGLAQIRPLIPQAAERLRSGGTLALEIGIAQADAVHAMLAAGPWEEIEVARDLAGRPRIALADRR